MVMIASASVVGLSVVVMNYNRSTTKAGAKQSADIEVDFAINKLTALLNTSNHCNANFRDRNIAAVTYVPGTGPIPANTETNGTVITGNLQTCPTSTCVFGAGVNAHAIDTASWDGNITGFPMGAKLGAAAGDFAGVSSRIRILKAWVSIDATSFPVPAKAPSGDKRPWMARMKVKIEKNLMENDSAGTKVTTNEFRYIFFPVTLSSKENPIDTTVILGCPRVGNTTVLP